MKRCHGRVASRRQPPEAVPSVTEAGSPSSVSQTALNLSELRAFGRLADEWKQPCTDRWGVILPPHGLNHSPSRLEEPTDDGQGSGSGKAGSDTRSREGRRAPAATGTASYPLESWLIEALGLEEVAWYHPDLTWRSASSSPAILVVPLRLLESLPYRAQLQLEIPATAEQWKRTFQYGYKFVPPVRARAVWDDGSPIRSHHENPDGSMCPCTPGDWGLGSPLEDLISFCACWVVKSLHDRLLHRWPGPQHYPAWLRILRNQPEEYCGCEKQNQKRSGACCMKQDFEVPFAEHLLKWFETRRAYFDVCRARDRGWNPLPVYRKFRQVAPT